MRESLTKKVLYIRLVRGMLASVFLTLLGNVSSSPAAQGKLDTAKI